MRGLAVIRPRFDADGTLPGGGWKVFHRQKRRCLVTKVQPHQTGLRQQSCRDLAVLQLQQPRLHIAAKHYHLDIRAHALDQRLASQ